MTAAAEAAAERHAPDADNDGLAPNAICYNAVIHACSREGNVERAKYWIEKMASQGVPPTVNSFSTIIDMLAKKGEINAALSWLKLMESSGIEADTVCYNMLFRAYSNLNEAEQAQSLF